MNSHPAPPALIKRGINKISNNLQEGDTIALDIRQVARLFGPQIIAALRERRAASLPLDEEMIP